MVACAFCIHPKELRLTRQASLSCFATIFITLLRMTSSLQVWSVLTDYSRLTEYVPNLDVCERLKGGTKTRYRLRQAGCSQSLFLRLEASAVLDVQEVEGTMGRRELRFSMIESENFKVATRTFQPWQSSLSP